MAASRASNSTRPTSVTASVVKRKVGSHGYEFNVQVHGGTLLYSQYSVLQQYNTINSSLCAVWVRECESYEPKPQLCRYREKSQHVLELLIRETVISRQPPGSHWSWHSLPWPAGFGPQLLLPCLQDNVKVSVLLSRSCLRAMCRCADGCYNSLVRYSP